MRSIITKFITIGVMLMLLVLIVSHFPKISEPGRAGHSGKPTAVSKLAIPAAGSRLRAD